MNSTISGKQSLPLYRTNSIPSSIFDDYEKYSCLKAQTNLNDYIEKKD